MSQWWSQAGVLPPAVVSDMGQKMQGLKAEIDALKQTTPPPDYTVDQIENWLSALENTPDDKAIHLLIERIDYACDDNKKTTINIFSTLTAVLGETGRGDKI